MAMRGSLCRPALMQLLNSQSCHCPPNPFRLLCCAELSCGLHPNYNQCSSALFRLETEQGCVGGKGRWRHQVTSANVRRGQVTL